jgi:hypothetical protein
VDKFWQKRYRNQFLNAINDNENEIKIKALDICASRGDESYLKTIEAHLSDTNKDVARSAWTAKFAILSRTNTEAAIKFLQESENNGGLYISYLKKIKDNISETKLRELTNNTDPQIQTFAFKQLLNMEHLSTNEIRSLLDNQSPELRRLAYLSLIDSGEKFDAKVVKEKWSSEHRTLLGGLLSASSTNQMEFIVSKIYDGYQKEALLGEINWLPSDTGALAYFSFGCRFFDSFKEQLHKDLDTDFKRIKDKYIENFEHELRRVIKEHISKDPKLSNEPLSRIEPIIEKMLENQMKRNLAEIEELDEFIKKHFILSALRILTLRGTSESLKYARKYADSNDKEIQDLVVQIISKYGNDEDVPALIKIAFNNYSSTKIEAVRWALKFSGFDKTVIKQFLESGEKEIVKTCLAYDLTAKLYSLTEDAKKLLMDKTDDIRLYALSYLANILASKKLDALLKTYLAGPTYYYNVVCWLDKILFAPFKIKKTYKKELLNMIKNEHQ